MSTDTFCPQPASRRYWAQHKHVTPQAVTLTAAAPSTPLVVDVSEHNGPITWTDVHGARGAFVRAGFGTQRADYRFAHNFAGVMARCPATLPELEVHGIAPRTYWFGYPDSAADGTAEARKYHGTLYGQPGALSPLVGWCLDAEDVSSFSKLSRRERRSYCDNFIYEMASATGRHGWFYSYEPFITEYLGNDYIPAGAATWGDCPCRAWIARYASDVPSSTPMADHLMRLWQFTDGQFGPSPHSVTGIGRCDISRLENTNLAGFLHFGNAA